MDKAELLARIAPCSLLCHTCGAYADGVMAELSRELLHYTQGVAEFEARYDEHRARQVQTARDFLAHYANTPCGGCRDKRNFPAKSPEPSSSPSYMNSGCAAARRSAKRALQPIGKRTKPCRTTFPTSVSVINHEYDSGFS